jgi:tetratricopeptide (TPR) repeat protein
LGASKVRLGDLTGGIDQFEKSYRLTKTSNNFDLAAIASVNEAIVYCKMKRFKESIQYCKQAMEITAKMNSTKCFEVNPFFFVFSLFFFLFFPVFCGCSTFNMVEL